MDIKVLSIALGKTVCNLARLDATGVVVHRRRLQRYLLVDFLEGLDPCIVAREARGDVYRFDRVFDFVDGAENPTYRHRLVPHVLRSTAEPRCGWHERPIVPLRGSIGSYAPAATFVLRAHAT